MVTTARARAAKRAPTLKPGATRRQLQTVLDAARFVRGWKFRVVSIDGPECTIELPFHRLLERPGRVVNGPALMAAADVAMWLVIKAHIGLDRDALTSELNTAFLAPARAESVFCTARILKLGKRSIYGIAECHSRSGVLFSHHTLTYVRLAPPA